MRALGVAEVAVRADRHVPRDIDDLGASLEQARDLVRAHGRHGRPAFTHQRVSHRICAGELGLHDCRAGDRRGNVGGYGQRACGRWERQCRRAGCCCCCRVRLLPCGRKPIESLPHLGDVEIERTGAWRCFLDGVEQLASRDDALAK